MVSSSQESGLKRMLYISNDRVSHQDSEGAIQLTYSGPTPDYIIRIRHPDGPIYFADKAKAVRVMECEGLHDMSLLPVDPENTG